MRDCGSPEIGRRGSTVERIIVAATTAALLLAVLLAASACGDAPVEPDGDVPGERLLFVTDRDGGTNQLGVVASEIYRIDADGGDPVRLTDAPASYLHLRVSPDGSRLVFESDRSSCYDVWVMGLDGSDLTQLTGLAPGERCNEMPRWSPDGTKVAFSTSRGPVEAGWEVWVMGADGSDPHGVSGLETSDWPHAWTPDGRVVFHAAATSGTTTYLVDPSGAGLEPLFDVAGDWGPYWSPDGGKVAFVSERDGDAEIWMMNADGSDPTNLTDHPARDAFDPWQHFADPWSPDGSRIAFSSDRDGDRDVFVMEADGTGAVNVSDGPGSDVFHGWSPDGSRIAFSSDRTADWDVYVVDADGTGLVNVTRHPAEDRHAVWIPEH